MSDNIHVAVRMRPLISRELESKAAVHWNAQHSTIYQTVSPSVAFQFDRVFQGHENNEAVYNEFCSPIVKSVIDGFNGTIFAYGQTSSGKTFTMMGDDDGKTLGVIHFTISDIFNFIQNMPEREFLLRVSYMEIYNEMVRDLLSDKNDKNENLKLHEDQNGLIKVNGLTEHIVQEAEQVLHLMRLAERKRRTGETRMNEKSSRSHSIFRMIIESGLKGESDAAVNVSQFNLVDLAGSERARQTKATGTRFKESININKSLLMLSQVISQLSEKVVNDSFINYRDSKLTRILQNSLGGNARTAIICTVTPACLDETVSTLKFAERAKSIRNKPKVNEVLTEEALLKKYANDIKKLTKELEATKEEKAQENKKLQDQIQNLKKKFVSQIIPEVKSRSNRRETWGGCLDASRIRLELLALRKPTDSANVSVPEEESRIPRRSFNVQRKFMPPFDDRSSLPCPPRSQLLSTELATLDEESEFDVDALEGEDSFFQSSKCYFGPSYDAPSQTDANVQTELELPNLLSLESEKQQMSEEILSLKRELAELHDFTTLERQFLRAKNRHSLDSKSRLSLDLNITELDNTKESSQLIIREKDDHDNQNSIETNMVLEDPASTIENKNIGNEDVFNSNLLELKTQSQLKEWNENESEILDYLANTIKILGKRKNIDPSSQEDNLNAPHKVILNMFNLVMQYQCLTFKGSFKTDLTDKIGEISQNLCKIFQTCGNNCTTDERKELAEDFMDKMDNILKEIEMFSLDAEDGKHGILNQSLFPESFLQRHSFDESVINVSDVKSPRYTPLKTIAEDSMTEVSTDSIEKESQSIDDALKDQISALEKDIETYRKSVEDFSYENQLKERQMVIFKDKVEVQEQIINGLKDEITLLSDKRNSSNIDALVIDSSSQTDNVVISSNVVTLVECCAQTSDELCKVIPYVTSAIVDSYTQTESPAFSDSLQSFNEACDIIPSKNTECSDYYSQIEDSSRLVDSYSQPVNEHSVNRSTIIVLVDCYSQTEVDGFLKDSTVFTNCSSQTSEDLLKFIPCTNTLLEASSQTEDAAIVKPFYENLSVDCTTQTSDSSFTVPPSFNTVSTSVDFGRKDFNPCMKGPISSEAVLQDGNVTYEKSDIEDNKEYLKGSHSSDKVSIEDAAVDANLKVTLNDLIELRIFALEFMKRDMHNYLGDIEFFENNESSSLLDQIKIEVTAIKELLVKLKLFIECQKERNEHLDKIFEEKNAEKFTLKDQLDSFIKEKDAEYLSLSKALLIMESAISELNQNVRNCENMEKVKRNDTNISIDNSTPLCYVNSLNKIIVNVKYLFNRKAASIDNLNLQLQEAEGKLKSLEEKNGMSIKMTKYVQTLEDERLQQVCNKLEEADVCVEDLKKEINNLTSKLEHLYNDRKVLEDNLEASQTEVKKMRDLFDVEKLGWTDSTMQCVKRVEEKCDQMMIEQENKFFDDINKLKLEQRLQLLEKSKNYKIQEEGLKTKIEQLKKEIEEMDNKLGEETKSRYNEKFKLEEQIRVLEETVRNVKQVNSTMKDKYRKYLAEFQRMKSELNKSVGERGTQTTFTQTKEEAAKLNSQTKIINNPIYIPDQNNSKPKPCDSCALLMQKISDLNENPSDAVAKATRGLRKEVYDLKAEIASLKRNNDSLVKEETSLKQELSSKLVLLRSCRCRLNPLPALENPDIAQAPIKKKNDLIHQWDLEHKTSEMRKENFTDPADILNNEIVKKAILEAKMQERAVLNSGSGPDGTIKCHYLMRKLNKKEKEIKELEEKIKELDAIIRNNTQKQNHNRQKVETIENRPVSPLKERHFLQENHFNSKPKSLHPFPEGAVPKVPKKILKEINRKYPTPIQDEAVKESSEKRSAVCDLDMNNAPIFNPLSKESCKKKENNENRVKDTESEKKRQLDMLIGNDFCPFGENRVTDKEAERKRQIEMLTGGPPDCRQQ